MFHHISVLLQETIDGLNIKEDGIYVDCTLGGGGHSQEILKRLTTGHLYCFDQDQTCLLYTSFLDSKYKEIINKLSTYDDKQFTDAMMFIRT